MYARAGLALLLALLGGATGCAKKMAPEASYGDYYDYSSDAGGGGAMGGAAMGMDMDMVEAEMAAPADAPPERASRRERRMSRKDVSASEAPGAPPAEPTSPPTTTGGSEPEPAVADDDPTPGRHIIYTATMQVSVFNLKDAMERAEAMPSKYGGYVQNMSGSYFVMRIPSAKLRTAMDEIEGLGVVDARTLDSQDVTEEFLDIQTRIEVLERTQKQMMELLTKARTVEEALHVRQSLDAITMELEVLKGRLRRLESLTEFSTLTVNLVERGPHSVLPSSNDPFGWVNELGVEATEWK
jgi:hypothetical protein